MSNKKQKTNTVGKKIHPHEFSGYDIFSQSLNLLTANYRLFIAIFLVVYLPLDILPALFPSLDQFQAYDSAKAAQLGNNQTFNIGYTIYSIFKGIIALLSSIAIIYATSKLYGDKNQSHRKKSSVRISLSESYSAAKLKWSGLFLTSLLAALIFIGLTLLLIIPGIIYYVYYAFFPQIVVLKNLNYKSALDYSKNLVKGRWWKVFGFMVMIMLLSLILGLIVSILTRRYPNLNILILLSTLLLDFYSLFVTLTLTVYFIKLDDLIHKK